jgi:isoleucyl-tRNA synthetase
VSSVHLAEFPKAAGTDDSHLLSDWERVFTVRDEVLRSLEEARTEKLIGSALEAKVRLTVDAETFSFLQKYAGELRYIFIVSQVEVTQGDALKVEVSKADGEKCERCWNYSTRVGESEKYPTACERCVEALAEIQQAAGV